MFAIFFDSGVVEPAHITSYLQQQRLGWHGDSRHRNWLLGSCIHETVQTRACVYTGLSTTAVATYVASFRVQHHRVDLLMRTGLQQCFL